MRFVKLTALKTRFQYDHAKKESIKTNNYEPIWVNSYKIDAIRPLGYDNETGKMEGSIIDMSDSESAYHVLERPEVIFRKMRLGFVSKD